MTNRRHDFADPLGYLYAIDAASLQVDVRACDHCKVTTDLIPMSGNGWAVEVFHETHCPHHEDNQPAAGMDFTGRDDV